MLLAISYLAVANIMTILIGRRAPGWLHLPGAAVHLERVQVLGHWPSERDALGKNPRW